MVNLDLSFCNTTLDHESVDGETPSYGSLTFHHMGLIISAVTGLFATVMSFYLMFMHATHYSKPWEQKHILRILFMIPIYSVVSFLSFFFYHHYVYYQVIRDCYDAFAIASFFSLLCHYIAPDLHAQKEYFRQLKPKNWLLPVNWFQKCCGSQAAGPWRKPRSGLTWFNICWIFVFQYCFLRVILTVVAVITEHYDRYCVEGLSPAYFHVWGSVISAVSVTLAMYCLIQFYYQIKEDISPHSPFIKILSIKLVIFFVFWQTIILSFLTGSGRITASEHIAQPDIIIGIPAMLVDFEMALFSILHLFAYPWKAYDIRHSAETGPELSKGGYQGGPFGVKAYLEAFNPWDIIKAIGRSFKWVVVGVRKRESDPSYKQHLDQTALQSGPPNKNGKYEQLHDAAGDDEHDAYDHPAASSASHPQRAGEYSSYPPSQSTTYPQAGLHQDTSYHNPTSAGQPTYSQDHQDTGYHNPTYGPTTGQTTYPQDEAPFYGTHAR